MKLGYYTDHRGHPSFRRSNEWIVYFEGQKPSPWATVTNVKSIEVLDKYAKDNKWKWVQFEDDDTFFNIVAEMDRKLTGRIIEDLE